MSNPTEVTTPHGTAYALPPNPDGALETGFEAVASAVAHDGGWLNCD